MGLMPTAFERCRRVIRDVENTEQRFPFAMIDLPFVEDLDCGSDRMIVVTKPTTVRIQGDTAESPTVRADDASGFGAHGFSITGQRHPYGTTPVHTNRCAAI